MDRIPPSKLKARLRRRQMAVGSWITLAHPAIAEILARAGFDWVAIDLEHSVITIREAGELIRVIDLCGCEPLVRLTSNDSDQIKRVMDAGAHGVIVPSVNSAAEAQKAVESVYYAPRGRRGVGLARAQGYGTRFASYRAWLKSNAVVIVMIEHEQAVRRIDAILSVDGVDGYLIGPYDLSSSLGVPGQLDHPKVLAAMHRVQQSAQKLKKPGGLHIVEPDPAALRDKARAGFKFLSYSLDTRMLDVSARSGLEILKRKA